jgi:hypothetical protein
MKNTRNEHMAAFKHEVSGLRRRSRRTSARVPTGIELRSGFGPLPFSPMIVGEQRHSARLLVDTSGIGASATASFSIWLNTASPSCTVRT